MRGYPQLFDGQTMMHNQFCTDGAKKSPYPTVGRNQACNSKNVKVRSDIARGPLNRLVCSYGSNPYAISGKVRVCWDLSKLTS